MQKIITLASAAFLLLSISPSPAAIKNSQAVTVVIPAESIATFIKPLLPYRIDFGENFSGIFWIETIENIKLKKNQISFATHIYGKNIAYAATIGNQTAKLVVGDVKSHNQWDASFRYDRSTKKLLIKPHIVSLNREADLKQGDLLLNTLLEALSGLEYPIELETLKPIVTEFNNRLLTVNMDISGVYAADNKLFLEIVPAARLDN